MSLTISQLLLAFSNHTNFETSDPYALSRLGEIACEAGEELNKKFIVQCYPKLLESGHDFLLIPKMSIREFVIELEGQWRLRLLEVDRDFKWLLERLDVIIRGDGSMPINQVFGGVDLRIFSNDATLGFLSPLWHEIRKKGSAVSLVELTNFKERSRELFSAEVERLKNLASLNKDGVAEFDLSDKQWAVLRSLFQREAFSSENRQTTANIACMMGDEHNSNLKSAVAGLKKLGLTKNKQGSGGGIWLSTAGRTLVDPR